MSSDGLRSWDEFCDSEAGQRVFEWLSSKERLINLRRPVVVAGELYSGPTEIALSPIQKAWPTADRLPRSPSKNISGLTALQVIRDMLAADPVLARYVDLISWPDLA